MQIIRDKFCTSCGKALPVSGSYCAECGAKVPNSVVESVTSLSNDLKEDAKSDAHNELKQFSLVQGTGWSATVFILALAVQFLGLALHHELGPADFFANSAAYSTALSAVSLVCWLIAKQKKRIFKSLTLGSAIWAAVSLAVLFMVIGTAVSQKLVSPTATQTVMRGDKQSCELVRQSLADGASDIPTNQSVSMWSNSEIGAMGRWLANQVNALDLAISSGPSPVLEEKLTYLREAFRETFKVLVYQDLETFVKGYKMSTEFVPEVLAYCDTVGG